jgi:hypothetical protein
VQRYNQKEWEHLIPFLVQISKLVQPTEILINTAGQAFTFSETKNAADTVVTSQTWSAGTIASPNLYGSSTTQLAGDKGTLAGTLSGTGVPTVTAGGPGSTATAQRTIELSVFK